MTTSEALAREPALDYKIDRLLDDPARFASMRTNARRMARPRAAFDIVSKLVALHLVPGKDHPQAA